MSTSLVNAYSVNAQA